MFTVHTFDLHFTVTCTIWLSGCCTAVKDDPDAAAGFSYAAVSTCWQTAVIVHDPYSSALKFNVMRVQKSNEPLSAGFSFKKCIISINCTLFECTDELHCFRFVSLPFRNFPLGSIFSIIV